MRKVMYMHSIILTETIVHMCMNMVFIPCLIINLMTLHGPANDRSGSLGHTFDYLSSIVKSLYLHAILCYGTH